MLASTILVRYFLTLSRRNGIIAVVYGDWPVRVLNHRGWTNDRQIYSRTATPTEETEVQSLKRYYSSRYKTVELLLEDEMGILDDSEFNRLRDVILAATNKKTGRGHLPAERRGGAMD